MIVIWCETVSAILNFTSVLWTPNKKTLSSSFFCLYFFFLLSTYTSSLSLILFSFRRNQKKKKKGREQRWKSSFCLLDLFTEIILRWLLDSNNKTYEDEDKASSAVETSVFDYCLEKFDLSKAAALNQNHQPVIDVYDGPEHRGYDIC